MRYCIDVPGLGDGIRLDAPLQAHTCKPGSGDQRFAYPKRTGFNPIVLIAYDRCIAASDRSVGALLTTEECSRHSSLRQGFYWSEAGQLYLAFESTDAARLCIGVAAGAGDPAGGRNHRRRDLTLQDCAAADPSLITRELAER